MSISSIFAPMLRRSAIAVRKDCSEFSSPKNRRPLLSGTAMTIAGGAVPRRPSAITRE
jgi:hypothetical protein